MATSVTLQRRSVLLQAVRSFFLSRRYLEVDTPVLLPLLIPESQIVPFCCEGRFLQTSPELCMKHLLARGCPRLFQLCHCFRRGESGRYHLPEFTMLEWYHAGWSYLELMAEVEELVRTLAGNPDDFPGLDRQGNLVREQRTVALHRPWSRMTVDAAFLEFAGIPAREALADGRFDEILVTEVEPNLGWEQPLFLYDYPVTLGSLARPKKDDPSLAERFELYICGIELGNGFSELVDPEEQRRRFEREIAMMTGRERQVVMPERFLASLAAMPETAGIALGFDRLLMLFSGAGTISEVVPLAAEEL
ncbi:MAG TPA: EF-P lysine aminoacylase GenX [Desulfobulbus sp.]|nr:EF-P lysine aminoacylase GenX [Desulfobulbus sp.]